MLNIISFVIGLYSILYVNDIEIVTIIHYHILYMMHQAK